MKHNIVSNQSLTICNSFAFNINVFLLLSNENEISMYTYCF